MGYLRQGQPASPPSFNRAAVTATITRFVAEELAFANRTADPFHIAHDCRNPSGHDFIAACGDVVCIHCGRIAWR